MILEGIVTTKNVNGDINIAPMGPIVDSEFTQLTLRPFNTSQTYQNLKSSPQGVLHVVDDVLLIAQAALGKPDPTPETFKAEKVDGVVLKSSCRWYEFEVTDFDDSSDRILLQATIVHAGRLKDFFGFNRAKHAVIEAAILATRVHLTGRESVLAEYEKLRTIVQKTASDREFQAFDFLQQYVEKFLAEDEESECGTAGLPSSESD